MGVVVVGAGLGWRRYTMKPMAPKTAIEIARMPTRSGTRDFGAGATAGDAYGEGIAGAIGAV